MFISCIFLGRFLARTLTATLIFLLEMAYNQLSRGGFGWKNRRDLQSVIYYIRVTRASIQTLLLFVGAAVSWSTLIRPVSQIREGYDMTSRALACVCVWLGVRLMHTLLIKMLTSRLHSQTFWEQLHRTSRQENILKKLAGLPIRPRPRSQAKKARWTLVKNARKVSTPFKNLSVGAMLHRANSDDSSLAVESPEGKVTASREVDDRSGDGPLSTSVAFQLFSSDFFTRSGSTSSIESGSADFALEVSRNTVAAKEATTAAAAAASGNVTGIAHVQPTRMKTVVEIVNAPPCTAPAVYNSYNPYSVSRGRSRVGSGSVGERHTVNAAAAAAVVGAIERPTKTSTNKVPMAVINAAVRHVRRGQLTVPFHVTTKAITFRKDHPNRPMRESFENNRSQMGACFRDTLTNDTVSTNIEADYVAQMMFDHLRRAGQPFITPEAVADFVEADRMEEAFDLIGGNEVGVRAVALANISVAMRKIFAEREALAKTLSDTSGLVKNVGVMFWFVLGTVALFVSLGIFRVDIASLWIVFSSALLAFAFVFGTTASTMFRALIMIFITNPFGIGDWVRFGKEFVMIKELGLNSFVVVNFWGEVINVPAMTMLDNQVYNLSRSPPFWMNIEFNVDIGFSASDYEHIQTTMSAFIDSDNTNYTPGSFAIFLESIEDPLKVHISIWHQLAFNASHWVRKMRTNTRFLLALQIALLEINISFAGTDGQIFKCAERTTMPGSRASSGPAPLTKMPAEQGGNNNNTHGGSTGTRPVDAHAANNSQLENMIERVEPPRSGGGEGGDGGGGGGHGFSGADIISDGVATDSHSQQQDRSSHQRQHDTVDVPTGTSHHVDNTTHIPGVGILIPEASSRAAGLRFRGGFRIPGKLRHYSGNLRDMKEVITFDAFDGQFTD